MAKDILSYGEKLRDPRWQRKRLEIYERDNFTCRFCFVGDKTLHLHHWGYEKGKEPWDYPDDNYLTLCEECHKTVIPNIRILEKEILRYIWTKLQFEVHIKDMAYFMERFDRDTLYQFFSVLADPILSNEELISNLYQKLNEYRFNKDMNFKNILDQKIIECQELEQ